MGTLSKRPLADFGDDMKERIEDFRTSVGTRIDDIRDQVDFKRPLRVLDRVPAEAWFACAGASLLGSFVLKLSGKNHASLFVGQLAPTFLVLALYRDRVGSF